MGHTGKVRISWIDTAKGICILLVVLQHSSNFTDLDYPLRQDFQTFRMPLYFMLSGLFFKTYEGFWGFAKRKINKLIIPYVFFFAVGGVILPILFYKGFDIYIWSYKYYGFDAFKYAFSEHYICNPSIWFLVCLFEVNILFYLICKISKFKCKNKYIADYVTIVLSLMVGCFGILLSVLHINIPYFMDSAFSATPFFVFGWLLRNKTYFLYLKRTKSIVVYSILFICSSMIIIHFFNYGNLSIMSNKFGGKLGVMQFYPYGIIGTISILSLARLMGNILLVSYLGRYSIIVLCIHAYIIQFSAHIASLIGIYNLPVVFILTSLICALAVPFFKRYLAYFTAQKDLIKI